MHRGSLLPSSSISSFSYSYSSSSSCCCFHRISHALSIAWRRGCGRWSAAAHFNWGPSLAYGSFSCALPTGHSRFHAATEDPWLYAQDVRKKKKKKRRSTFHDATSAYRRTIKDRAHSRLKFTRSPLSSRLRYNVALYFVIASTSKERKLMRIKFGTKDYHLLVKQIRNQTRRWIETT